MISRWYSRSSAIILAIVVLISFSLAPVMHNLIQHGHASTHGHSDTSQTESVMWQGLHTATHVGKDILAAVALPFFQYFSIIFLISFIDQFLFLKNISLEQKCLGIFQRE